MGVKLKLLALSLAVAGLFAGSAARAQGTPQSESYAYALTLIDAGSATTPANSQTGGAITDGTQYVRVKVTVSIPRAEGAVHTGVPVKAMPVRLMYRAHRGPATAFNGSITLLRDAPYAADGSTPATTAWYPMPQRIGAGDTTSQLDPTALNYLAVAARSTTNVNGAAYSDYVAWGQTHDPARWESTFLSAEVYDTQAADFEEKYPMIASLLKGEATYEWYAASRYGLGSFTRISDIQDLGRKMDFTDVRLWESLTGDADSATDAANMDSASKSTLGTAFEWRLRAMPKAEGWHLYRASIGSNYADEAGVQLLNVQGASNEHNPRIESPRYPDGISSISFEAKISGSPDEDPANAQELQVQMSADGTTWENVGEPVVLSTAFQAFEVAFGEAARGECFFRIVRVSYLAVAADAYLTTAVVRKLRVRSAKPVATFSKPTCTPNFPGYAAGDGSFSVAYQAAGSAAAVPRGYEATLKLRRRAEGDATCNWYEAPVSVSDFLETDGSAKLTASFTKEALVINADGSVNATEGAFFLSPAGTVSGLMPGVYDLRLDCAVLGSFKAGRESIDERETASVSADSYTETITVEGETRQVVHPAVLDYREQETNAQEVFLRVSYRSGTTASTSPYTLETLDVPLLPSGTTPNQWRVDVAKTLKLADETAVYVWGYDPEVEDVEPTFATGYLSFKVGVRNAAGNVMWFGQATTGSVSASVMPAFVDVEPAVSETIRCAGANEADAVPVVVRLEPVQTSHVMVEVSLPTVAAAGVEAVARIGGSYWQDFNTWAQTALFTETDFRENMTAVTADFSCTTGNVAGEYYVDSGWIPDEGPLADTTSFTESFETSRGDGDPLELHLPTAATLANNYFASWGASHEAALPSYLLTGSASNITRYLALSRTSADLVLSRSYSSKNGKFYPDAMLRLRGTGATAKPRSDSRIVLNGVGTVSFTLGLSLPYDVSRRVQVMSTGSDSYDLAGYGLAAGITFNRPAETCAASGFSVSYFLESQDQSAPSFELRLTQVMRFGDDASVHPSSQVVAELYRWTNNMHTATRLELAETSGTARATPYYLYSGELLNRAFGLWVRSDGRLAVGLVGSPTPNALNESFRSRDVEVTEGGKPYILSLGSADCRPNFRYVLRAPNKTDAFSGGNVAAIALADAELRNVITPAWGAEWTMVTDSNSQAHIQISRKSPSAQAAGRVLVQVVRNDVVVASKTVAADKTGQQVSVTMGKTDATLILEPFDDDCNVFIDNLTVSSWCGNDENRNGEARVPSNTNVGFAANDGFSGVGIWVRPEEDEQLNVVGADYTGAQCALLQYSRRNLSAPAGVVTTDEIGHTGNQLALYSPFSSNGFGAVSFRYRIPTMDEFGSNKQLPAVYVMLQFLSHTRAYRGFLAENHNGWANVSGLIELQNTGGTWQMATIRPTDADGNELTGKTGTLRLVMVTKANGRTYVSDDEDAYVYIDDFTVTDNGSESVASWSAKNVKISDLPVSQLYWKDREAFVTAPSAQETFAEKSLLTRGIQFNDVGSGDEVEGDYDTSILTSPELANGVGRVSFAARLVSPSAKPVRLYLLASEYEDENVPLKPVTYVEVSSTVYKVYDVDLSKYTHYYTIPNADNTPGSSSSGDLFTNTAVKRLRLRAYVNGDGQTTDGFGSVGSNREIVHGRVLVDQVAISNPIQPSLRVKSVAFSNIVGGGVGPGAVAEFDRTSPLSQPVANAPAMRVMVTLDQAQLLKPETIRVFVTFKKHTAADVAAALKRYDGTDSYSYTSVMGTPFDSAEAPIYAWDPTRYAEWPLSAWFNLSKALDQVNPGATTGPLTTAQLSALLNGQAGTDLISQELTCVATDTYSTFMGDLTALELNKLDANDLVQYNAWAVYQSSETDKWYATQITKNGYEDFSWYFPRNLNSEIQTKADEAAGGTADTVYFSPYYWVYSCLPGEVFLNEFNIGNDGASQPLNPFVELCAPAGLDIGNWQVRATDSGSFTITSFGFQVPEGTAMKKPDTGAVPSKRTVNTASNRAFFTASNTANRAFARIDGGRETIGSFDDGTDGGNGLGNTRNGGVVTNTLDAGLTGSNKAASLLLLRPTGGAEHIVCFAWASSSSITADLSDVIQQRIDTLYDLYLSTLTASGFGPEWYQTFLEESWDTLATDFGPIAVREPALESSAVKAHARRITKANYFPADIAADNRFKQDSSAFAPVQDREQGAYANSIATIDMGGIWVTRKNAIDTDADNGPLDLTELCDETQSWPQDVNPVYTPRRTEITGATVAPGAQAPYTQVTPLQINPDQFLTTYRELSSSIVTSSLAGNAFGTHALTVYSASGDTALEVRRAGRTTPNSWSLTLETPKVTLTYSALAFHQVATASLRLIDVQVGSAETDLDKIRAQIPGATLLSGPDAEGWVSLDVSYQTNGTYALTIDLLKPGHTSNEERYNVEASASFSVASTDAASDVITHVSPACGGTLGGSATQQPWWGSGFGFAVDYDEAALPEGTRLTAFLVTYPSPAGNLGPWDGFDSAWTGKALSYPDPDDPAHTVDTSLIGAEYDQGLAALAAQRRFGGNLCYTLLTTLDSGRALSTSAVGILGDSYATARGYSAADSSTWTNKEPAIPFWVWGVYTCTVQADTGTSTVSFLMPQAAPHQKAGLFTVPTWYTPLTDLNAATPTKSAPYFYLYSTPPQSAWLNEINLEAAGGSTPYAEVVMPFLRDGILAGGVSQTTSTGWKVRRYTSTGTIAAEEAVPETLVDASGAPIYRSSASYTYNTIDDFSAVASPDLSAYVLIRPCGAAEGGVWSQVDDTGGTAVSAPADVPNAPWLAEPATSFVVPGESDSSTTAGSVQLVGATVTGDDGQAYLSSAVSQRTLWDFSDETKNLGNGAGSLTPDVPEWNRVTFTSLMRNTVYGGVLCGYHTFDFFTLSETMGSPSTTTLTLPRDGGDWVYNENASSGLVLSYRPRTNYRFERLRLPAELVGHVMLIGQDRTLTRDEVNTEVRRLRAEATTDPSAPYTTWLQMGSADVNGLFRADVELGSDGTPTGLITFNPAYQPSPTDPDLTFGDQDAFVLTLVFVDEPVSAQNAITLEMGQGDVQTGAWLVSQSFYALDADGNPDASKGGDTATKPIWSDDNGNKDGEHANVHGWVYQPIVGDQVGMSIVLNPELGLIGGSLGADAEAVHARFAADSGLRPFLVWNLIPKRKVPENLFDGTLSTDMTTRGKFMDNWHIGGANWLTGMPSIADRTTVSLSTLRKTLKTISTSTDGFYQAAGVIPMAYRGFCTQSGNVATADDPADPPAGDTLLSFTTLSESELADALANATLTGLSNDDDSLLAYTAQIDMTNPEGLELWQDGAVLRFAVVIANPLTGLVYDCQALANFTSEGLDAYCPWYVPDAQSNINYITNLESKGYSPYAWVYAIPQGSVWINEFRPFASSTLADDDMPTAFELAMKASPLGSDGQPLYSLDGWKVQLKYAPLPALDAEPETPLAWTVAKNVPLHAWVPFSRILASASSYELDYYCATTDVTRGFSPDPDSGISLVGRDYATVGKETFSWLKLDQPLFAYGFDDTLAGQAAYADGVIYAIALVRSNGVVEDEVLFYAKSRTTSFDDTLTGRDIDSLRADLAVRSENVNVASAGTVRGLTYTPLIDGVRSPSASAQFVLYSATGTVTDDSRLDWFIDIESSGINTFPGANIWNTQGYYRQPNASYVINPSTTSTLSAHILGSNAQLFLSRLSIGTPDHTGQAISATYANGTGYTLELSGWDTAWYALAQVTCNGQPLTLPTPATVYTLSDDGAALSTSTALTVAQSTLTEDTDYALTFVYTPAAAQLAASGDLASEDDGFLAWLLQTHPDAILSQTAADGVTAAEKYWLGFDSADYAATDVALRITTVGTHAEPDGSEHPLLGISLTDGEAPISDLRGDGQLILLGKEALTDEWHYLRRLYPEDINGDNLLILSTEDRFFKAILLSTTAAEALR